MQFRLGAFPFELPLQKPFDPGGGRPVLSSRKGFLLRLKSLSPPHATTSYGEASPFPGLNPESMNDLEGELGRLQKRPIELGCGLLNLQGTELLKTLGGEIDRLASLPSLRWGLGAAALDFLRIQNSPAFQSFDERAVPCHDLVQTDDLIEDAAKTGTIKIKLGRGSFEEDFALVRRLVRAGKSGLAAGRKPTYILDANRAWNTEQAATLLNYVNGKLQVAYVEEPLREAGDFASFAKKSPLPLGLDESLPELKDFLKTNKMPSLGAVVLKPTAIGSFLELLEYSSIAEANDAKVVVSSCLESNLGLSGLLYLIHVLGLGGHSHGLDTAKYFDVNVMRPSPQDKLPKQSKLG